MLTPSMKPQNNNNRENITGRPSIKNPLPQIPENQQEENSSFIILFLKALPSLAPEYFSKISPLRENKIVKGILPW